MIKNKIELFRGGQRVALLTWHKKAEDGSTIPIAMEFSEDLDEESRQRVIGVCERPANAREGGQLVKCFPGSSKHFTAIPPVLERLGYRVHCF